MDMTGIFRLWPSPLQDPEIYPEGGRGSSQILIGTIARIEDYLD
jgi:hypothetical protein